MNFLNIQFRFEGIMITTHNYFTYYADVPNAWIDAQIAKIPDYSRADFINYSDGFSW